jgi:hypothetical protein
MPFRAELRKYIQVDEFEDEMMQIDDDEDDVQGWNQKLEQEFEESIRQIDISANNGYDDLRFPLKRTHVVLLIRKESIHL